ncbi:bifunctional DNA primase/polymerase [Aerococcaceae bacterium zg-B36]|uniref:bifunctional DNA primase/polymerase n=1 Tax=Aerococcaceae bacterium zg-252 TaxID=2796928 RepID=UPI001BD8F6F1|nr:bifunctional DNA primase/polymerase [Aerococcaceae bacterium zg-B36]
MNGYEIALALLGEGIQTIPLSNTKMPLFKFANIPITKELIEANKELYQRAKGLGWLCRGYWCIDIDRHGTNGFESIKQSKCVDELRANAQKTMVQHTPSKGMHLVFKKREGVEYRQKINYLDGVDIKAQDNNYFVMFGSQTAKGVYTWNEKEPIVYVGEFEQEIFKPNTKPPQKTYGYFGLIPKSSNSKGGLGKQAYQRIINGTSIMRNNDLYLASTYAKSCGISLEPLKVLIGDDSKGDVFTEEEWYATVNSANNMPLR